MSSAAVVKNVSKPFWMARYPMATARCVLPRPVLPCRINDRPSVTKSGPRYEPGRACRRVDCKSHGLILFQQCDENREQKSVTRMVKRGIIVQVGPGTGLSGYS